MQKADLVERGLAFLIDVVFAVLVSIIPVVGGIAGMVYMLVRDGLFGGRSIGKKVVNIRVVRGENTPASYADSVKRNALLAFPEIFLIVPLLGLAVYAVVMALVVATETVAALTDRDGRRFGDRFAGTRVVKAASRIR